MGFKSIVIANSVAAMCAVGALAGFFFDHPVVGWALGSIADAAADAAFILPLAFEVLRVLHGPEARHEQ